MGTGLKGSNCILILYLLLGRSNSLLFAQPDSSRSPSILERSKTGNGSGLGMGVVWEWEWSGKEAESVCYLKLKVM